MNMKGQGALEYLLLIGGAIVVAVIVVTLLLGVGSSSGSQTEITAAANSCTNAAALTNTTSPSCSVVNNSAGAGELNEIWTAGSCWTCAGTYPSCNATELAETQAQCADLTANNP